MPFQSPNPLNETQDHHIIDGPVLASLPLSVPCLSSVSHNPTDVEEHAAFIRRLKDSARRFLPEASLRPQADVSKSALVTSEIQPAFSESQWEPRTALHSAETSRWDAPQAGCWRHEDENIRDGVVDIHGSSPDSWKRMHQDAYRRYYTSVKSEGKKPLVDVPRLPTKGPEQIGYRRMLSGLLHEITFMPPTSPLAQSSTTDDGAFDEPTPNPFGLMSRTIRRSSFSHSVSSSRSVHRPRASIATAADAAEIVAPLRSRCRRPSAPGDCKMARASLAGNYEESLLQGRMSTPPSIPVEFSVQIGVKGRGKCKASLRNPETVRLPFKAVYYEWPVDGEHEREGLDAVSPYVGVVDLENGLERANVETETIDASDKKGKRVSAGTRVPPGGSYRIPTQGQFQIMIKNPHDTPVKLFVISYNLTEMPGGTKTFIRQRGLCYDFFSLPNLPLSHVVPHSDRSCLRYLIHLNICSPSKGRLYLYKDVRVVFPNRQIDGKESVKNEVIVPEPRWSPYKAVRRMSKGIERRGSSVGSFSGWRVLDEGMGTDWRRDVHALVFEDEEENGQDEAQMKMEAEKRMFQRLSFGGNDEWKM